MRTLTIRDYPEEIGKIIQRILVCDYTLTGYYIEGELTWTLLYTGNRDIRILELAISEYIVYSDKSIWTMPLSTSSKGLKSYYKSLKSIGFSSVRWRTTARTAPYEPSLGPVWPVDNHRTARSDFWDFSFKIQKVQPWTSSSGEAPYTVYTIENNRLQCTLTPPCNRLNLLDFFPYTV